MTTTIFLVRHATHDLVGSVLTGRMPGIHLGELGRRQAEQLAERLRPEAIAAVYASPLERAHETAARLADRLGVPAVVCEGITDIDYGEWSGQRFDALDNDPRWAQWNRERATARPPGGESMDEVRSRALGKVDQVAAAHPDGGAVVVSHCDVIKAILAHYLGLGFEAFPRFEISPASVSTLLVGGWGAKVHAMNEVVPA